MPPTAPDRLAARLDALLHRLHRRRLEHCGLAGALDPDPAGAPWTDARPVREANDVELLIDGAAALPAIADAIRGATDHVHLSFWALDPQFMLVRGREGVTLRGLLAAAAERVDVRLLLWGGAPLPIAHPWMREARRALAELLDGTRIDGRLDTTGRFAGATHEKIVVVDGRTAFVGGMDPTALAGDRYDEPGHPYRPGGGWHDAHARVRGPVVADVAEHFRARWRDRTGEDLAPTPPPPPAGSTRAQLVRSLPAKGSRDGRGEFSALQATLRALSGAQRLIYLESQYLWSVEITRALADKLRRPPHPDFRVVAVLPHQPRTGYPATRGRVRTLEHADDGAGRLVVCSLRTQPDADGARRPVYVHAKLLLVDDAWLSVGSLNMSDHSLFNALEVQLVTDDADLARDTRERLWSEHLELDGAEVRARPAHELVDAVWRPTSAEQLERERRGAPLTARIVRLEDGSVTRRVLGSVQELALGR